jgi:hypothetical protein
MIGVRAACAVMDGAHTRTDVIDIFGPNWWLGNDDVIPPLSVIFSLVRVCPMAIRAAEQRRLICCLSRTT